MGRKEGSGVSRELNPGRRTPDVLVGLALLFAIGGIALAYESWLGHALIAIVGLMLMIYSLTTGAMLRGRIKRTSANVFRLHKRSGIYLGSLILGSFVYGLWMRLQHGDPLLSSVHGKLGLIVLFIMILQLVPSLVLKDRARYRGLHRVLGYALAPILVLDTTWGLHNAVLGGTKSLVLVHSISGGLAALALAWIILETLYPTERGLRRARVASYLAAFLVTAGCWIVGGYNYLTAYGSQVKPAILAGPEPWVHQIVMETKEHIFIFLPIIALALSLSLYYLEGDSFPGDARSRRAINMIACLALFLVLLMFLMGAVISNAGSAGVEA